MNALAFDKPLFGKKILVTRATALNDGLYDRLTQLGAEVIAVPTITIKDPPDWKLFDETSRRLQGFDWIIFTSAHAVQQTRKRLLEIGHSLDQGGRVMIAAVGNQTAKMIKEAGWKVDLIPENYQAEGLIELFSKMDLSGKAIWFPRALEAREVLVESLTKMGARIELAPVYQNVVPLENKLRLLEVLKMQKPDWITFTSSSTVDNFFRILDENPASLNLPKIASIGKITTQCLQKHSITPHFTADPQNFEGLCDGIIKHGE
ncbi:MAG: uroporphyrinogen-III synthase [Deltaproteobacteria bacterium]|nr:uroporphyrinogen-III synthase [Deltaproteobacteria bacterium]